MKKVILTVVGLAVGIIQLSAFEAKGIEFIDSGQRLGSATSLSVALGDLDGDGDLDAFVGNFRSPNEVWLNNGAGIFSDSGQRLGIPGNNAFSVALGDLDGDGDLDAFCANIGDALIYGAPNCVYMNNGAGIFTDSGQRLGNVPSLSVALGDLDDDGDLDAFVGNFGNPSEVWLNDGAGIFTDSGQRLGRANSFSVALGDLDNDGDLDAFVSSDGGGGNKVWLNNGLGIFSDSGQSLGSTDTASVALGDLDSDGDLDVFLAKMRSKPNMILINNGSATFSDSGQYLGSFNSMSVALGDLDKDGDLDAFIGNWSDSSGEPNQVYLNNGSGVFTDSGLRLGNAPTTSIGLGDLDGDGDLDAFVANDASTPNEVWWNIPSVVLITLADFKASPENRKVTITWTTTSEMDNAGFNLYRAETENGEYVKINISLIPAQGSPTSSATYQFIDENVKNRRTYYYKLEDIDLNGTSTMHGPVSVEPKRFGTRN